MKTIIGLAAVLLVFGLVGNADHDQQMLEQGEYCEMVALFVATNGELGWPAHREEITCGN